MKHRWTIQNPAEHKRIRQRRIPEPVGEVTLQLGEVAFKSIQIIQN